MKEILLSFKPNIFELIRSGKKIFEYRKNFPDGKVRAYMYVSKPVQQIVGYVDLDNRIDLIEWENKYSKYKEVSRRIDEYRSRNNKYVMPIMTFQMTSSISLEQIRKNISKFVIPQSYYYLSTFPELNEFVHNNIIEYEEKIHNDFSVINQDDICILEYK